MLSTADVWATFRDLCVRLDIIASVRSEQKINIETMTIDHKGWVTSFVRRFIHPQSRLETVDFINSTIERCLKFLLICDEGMRDCLKGKLESSRTGLECLRQTYRSDPAMCAQLACCDVMLNQAL